MKDSRIDRPLLFRSNALSEVTLPFHLTNSRFSVKFLSWNETTLSPGKETYEKIVTHNDFDGIVSAALCAWALGVDRLFFAGPLTITKGPDHDHGKGCGLRSALSPRVRTLV